MELMAILIMEMELIMEMDKLLWDPGGGNAVGIGGGNGFGIGGQAPPPPHQHQQQQQQQQYQQLHQACVGATPVDTLTNLLASGRFNYNGRIFEINWWY